MKDIIISIIISVIVIGMFMTGFYYIVDHSTKAGIMVWMSFLILITVGCMLMVFKEYNHYLWHKEYVRDHPPRK